MNACVTFKTFKLWYNMWLAFFFIHCTTPACMCQACVPMLEIRPAFPGNVNGVLGSPAYAKLGFYSKLFFSPFLSVFWSVLSD